MKKKIIIFHSNQKREYISNRFVSYYQGCGIHRQLTQARTLQQNGVVK